MPHKVTFGSKNATASLCWIEYQVAVFNQYVFVYPVGTPLTVFISLQPVNTNNGIITVWRVPEIIIHIRFVVSKFPSPYHGIGQCFLVPFGMIGINMAEPCKVLPVIEIGNFGFIHIKRRNGYPSRLIVPFFKHIFINTPHNKSTTLNKNQTRSRLLFDIPRVGKTKNCHFTGRPASSTRSLSGWAKRGGLFWLFAA